MNPLEQTIALQLLSFDSDTAWDLGTTIRNLVRESKPHTVREPIYISITHANSDQPLFCAASCPGVIPNHLLWAEATRDAVKRWELSTASLYPGPYGWKFDLPGPVCRAMRGVDGYCSGGWPIRVKGVGGVVAVVVVVGISYGEERTLSKHKMIVKALEEVQLRQNTDLLATVSVQYKVDP